MAVECTNNDHIVLGAMACSVEDHFRGDLLKLYLDLRRKKGFRYLTQSTDRIHRLCLGEEE